MGKAEVALIAAIAAVGKTSKYDWRWQADVEAAVGPIAAMMDNDRYGPMPLAEGMFADETKRFTTHYGGHSIEESSTRAVIRFVDDEGRPVMTKGKKPEQETVRTERTDTPAGKRMLALLETLEQGQRIAVWIVLVQVNDDLKVRNLIHLQPMAKRKDEDRSVPARQDNGSAPDEPPPPPDPDEPAQPRQTPGAADQVNTPRVIALREKAKEILNDYQWAFVARKAAEKGIDVNGLSEVEWDTEIRPLCREASRIPEQEESF